MTKRSSSFALMRTAPLTHELSHTLVQTYLTHIRLPLRVSQEDGEQVGRDSQVPAWPH